MQSGEGRFRGSVWRISSREQPALWQFVNRSSKLRKYFMHVAVLVDSLASLVGFAQFEGDAAPTNRAPRGRCLPIVQIREGHGVPPFKQGDLNE